jgi:hypothetical protein
MILLCWKYRAKSLFPSSVGGCDNVCGNIGNFIISKTSAKGRHGVLSVGDLGNDRLLRAASGKVLVKSLLLKSLVRHDNILSASVACSAVGVEDLLTSTNITSKCRGDGDEGDGGSSGSTLDNLL